MRLRKFQKDPDERKRYGINYTDWLEDGEKIIAINLLVTGQDSSLVADGEEISVDGGKIIFFVSGGTSGKQYTVHVTITTSIAQIREDTILFVVIAL